MDTEISVKQEKYLTPVTISKRLDVSLETICRLLRRGELKGHKVGKQWRIPETFYEEFLAKTLNQPEN